MPNERVTSRNLQLYVQVFLRTLSETAKRFLPEPLRGQLWHTSLLPAEVVCYVSRRFGIAIEYQPADTTTVRAVRGSARVVDRLF